VWGGGARDHPRRDRPSDRLSAEDGDGRGSVVLVHGATGFAVGVLRGSGDAAVLAPARARPAAGARADGPHGPDYLPEPDRVRLGDVLRIGIRVVRQGRRRDGRRRRDRVLCRAGTAVASLDEALQAGAGGVAVALADVLQVAAAVARGAAVGVGCGPSKSDTCSFKVANCDLE